MTPPVVDQPVPVLGQALRIAVIAALTLSIVGATVGGDAGRYLSGACIALIVAAPLLRVVMLSAAWYRRGDRRFAAVGAGLLAIVAIGALIAGR
jgi:uncharacterized membrane protein